MRPSSRQMVTAALAVLVAGCGGGGGFKPDWDAFGDPGVEVTTEVTGDGVGDPVADGVEDPASDPVGDVPTECADDDGDGVCNEDDVCEGGDDTVDSDGDTIPDFCDCEGLTCGANAHCEDLGSGPECVCDDGYEGDGTTCTDIDECTLGTDTCDANATCTNTDGGYTCACNAGYDGDGFTCTDIDECTLGTDTCDTNATCTNTDGGYTCACNTGYDGDGFTCAAIDHCARGTDSCHTNATCAYTGPGTYSCTCNTGYSGDGFTCTPIDHCALGTDTCDTNATCTYTGPGTYSCACNSGYTGDGFTCTPVTTGCDDWSESFTTAVIPTTQCTTWNAFKTGLATSGYTSVTMSGTYDTTGITCTDPTVVQAIATALRTGTTGFWTCGGHTWNNCDYGGWSDFWIDPPSSCSGSDCPNPGYIVRPCIGNTSFGGVNTRTCGDPPTQDLSVSFCGGGAGCTLTGTPVPSTVLSTIDQTYYFNNNLVNSIWHGPSDRIIGGHYSVDGYYSFAAGASGYPQFPTNDTGTDYDRMVHVPATNTAVRTDNGQFASPYNRVYIGTIDGSTGALSGFATAVFGDGFTGTCDLISASASEFLCWDGTAVRHYTTTEGSASLSLASRVTLATAPHAPCPSACYGGTFGWDGMFYYFAYDGQSSTDNRYQVYSATGSLVGTYSATPSGGGVNGVYFDWSVCRYATHSGFGTRGGGSTYVWSGGSASDDSQVYGPVSTYHAP